MIQANGVICFMGYFRLRWIDLTLSIVYSQTDVCEKRAKQTVLVKSSQGDLSVLGMFYIRIIKSLIRS